MKADYPRIRAGLIHELIERHDRGEIEPLEVVEYLRGRLGTWTPGKGGSAGPMATSREPDPMVVDHLIAGRISIERAHPADIKSAVHRLTLACLSAREIANRLGMTTRSVVRYRSLNRRSQ